MVPVASDSGFDVRGLRVLPPVWAVLGLGPDASCRCRWQGMQKQGSGRRVIVGSR